MILFLRSKIIIPNVSDKKMILKIVWSKEDDAIDYMEIDHIYTETDYMEAAIGKNTTPGDREIILQNNEVWITMAPESDSGEDLWEEVVVYTDNMVEVKKYKNNGE